MGVTMSVMKVGLSALALVLMAGNALAQEKGCILLKTVAENEIVSKDAQGNQTTRVVPVDKIVPGDEVIYRISATNICDQAAESVVIDNAVPEHMNYIGKSA